MIWILDAGHGTETPGKRSPDLKIGFKEGVFNRQITKKIMEIGKAHHIIPIISNSPIDISIKQRVQFINHLVTNTFKNDKCALISVHADAMGDGSKWTEHSGHKVLHFPGSPNGKAIAHEINYELGLCLPYQNLGLRERDDLGLLKATKCPAVIVECGHMTNIDDVKIMKTKSYQYRIAQAFDYAMTTIENRE